MTFAYIYLFYVLLVCIGMLTGQVEINWSNFNVTNILIAFGIINVCNRIDQVINKIDSYNKFIEMTKGDKL